MHRFSRRSKCNGAVTWGNKMCFVFSGFNLCVCVSIFFIYTSNLCLCSHKRDNNIISDPAVCLGPSDPPELYPVWRIPPPPPRAGWMLPAIFQANPGPIWGPGGENPYQDTDYCSVPAAAHLSWCGTIFPNVSRINKHSHPIILTLRVTHELSVDASL